jgi:hypothetical protein
MTITSVRIYYHCENKVQEAQLTKTHWGFAIKDRLKGPEAKGVNITNFMLYENPTLVFRIGEWWKPLNSFEFSCVYDLQSLEGREPIENIKELMKFTSAIALQAPWPQVVAVGEALAVPLSQMEQESLLPYLRWPRDRI